ncbi:MAG TPA: hypothetical protein VJO33_00530 [Gemmatimonadaceae bacterium]|nr:hypothetical protein [Gemmatimonadaceae bacterium]
MPLSLAKSPLMFIRLTILSLLAALSITSRVYAQTLRVVASEYAFRAPASARPGLNRVVLVNQGKELHHIVILRLPDSLDASRAFGMVMQHQSLGNSHSVGGPGAIFPGDSSVAWITLEEGRYMFLRFIPAQDKRPHAMKGMIAQLNVTGDRLAAGAPAATLTLSASEYALDLSVPPSVGAATIEFRNTGSQDHDYALVQLPDSADPIATARRLGSADTTLKYVKLVGGSGPLGPGRRSWNRATLLRGHYAVICFAADQRDGRSHYLHGMVRTFDVR